MTTNNELWGGEEFIGIPPQPGQEVWVDTTPARPLGIPELTVERYMLLVVAYFKQLYTTGLWSRKMVEDAADEVDVWINKYGLTQDIPYYKEVIKDIQTKRKEELKEKEARSEWMEEVTEYIQSRRDLEEKEIEAEARRKEHIKGVGALQEAQRERILEARHNMDIAMDYILDTDWIYEDKRDRLFDMLSRLGDEGVPPGRGVPGRVATYPYTTQDIENIVFASLPPQEQTRLREQAEYRPPPRERPSKEPAIRYESIFEQIRRQQQPQEWQRRFEANYPNLLRQYQTGLAEGVVPTAKGWEEWIKRPQLREEWGKERERYERPWAFAPRITTVQF
jgi:hypothetical protein